MAYFANFTYICDALEQENGFFSYFYCPGFSELRLKKDLLID